MHRTTRFRVLVITALIILSASLAFAQQVTGSLSAIVVDKSGAVIPNAKITMTNELSGDIRRSTTNQDGYFSISGVFPGTYTVQVEANGFSTYIAKRVTFNPGDRRTLPDITLDVAATGTTVEVSGVLEELTPVDSGEKAAVITQKQLQNVAVVSRSAAEFIKILPGMVPTPGIENRNGWNGENIGINGNGDGGKQSAIGNYSANGTPTGALVINADGAQVDDPGCNCATPVNPNPDMIAEMKIQTSNFAAENSRGPVVINAITKSGGKDFHGSAYFSARHFSMNSNYAEFNARGIARPNNKYYFPGGNISGPVVLPKTNFNKNRDKMFFFAGFEAYRQTIDTGLLQSIVPTEQMRNGDFSNTAYLDSIGRRFGAAGGALDPVRFPGSRIPASQIEPGMRRLLALTPLPNIDPAGAGQSYNWAQALTLDQNMYQFTGKVDYNFSDYTKLYVRYNLQNEVQPFPIQLWWRNAGAVPMPSAVEGKNRSDSIAANLTKVLSPSLTNEFVFGYTFVDFPNQYQDYSKMTRASNNFPYRGIFRQDDKIPGFLSWAAPTAGMWLAGGFDPILFATKHLFTVSDNLSKVVGTHTMKFGGYYGYVVNKQPGNEPSAGLIQFSPWHGNHSGNLLADMVAGLASDYTENSRQIVRDMGWGEFAFFAQDNWKITKRFTLEYGMRFQHIQPWTARNGIGIATWVPQSYSQNAPASQFPGVLWNAKDKSVSLAGWGSRPLFYAPRISAAFDIFGNGSTVFRGGFGTFVFHDPQLASGAMDLPGGVRRYNVGGGVTLPGIDAIQSQGDLVFGGEAVDAADNRQNVTHSYSATISQRLRGRNLLEVAWVGNRTRNLINNGELRNVNKVPIGAMLANPTGNANDFRPLRQYQALNVFSHNFYSNYDSLQTSLTRQAGNFFYTLSYTWSKAMGIGQVLDGFNLDNNYGPLGFDRTHVFSSTYVYTLPNFVKTGSKFAKGAVNGWQISGVIQAWSGPNLQQNSQDGNFGLNAAGPGGQINAAAVLGTDAIRVMPRVTCDPRASLGPNQFANGACFAPPIAGSGGRPGVNGDLIFPYMRGPAYFNTDLTLFKSFAFSESKRLEFRAAAFNFPNHPVRSFLSGDSNLRLNFDEQGRMTSPRFGFADNRVGRRNIQLTVKFLF
ncbi:MAG: carboxypeptidase regulatory-like domain-containing protein [Bryobacterales bacterium]|nr:carboxypeptidase regulatory-like domain-containing protein [Bryobacterales bacterium]